MSVRRNRASPLDAWPGYVDALSTLLMVIIFVLLVFALAQGFLSVSLTSRDRALDRLNRQVSELAELLALEQGTAGTLRDNLARTDADLRAATRAREALDGLLRETRAERDRGAVERDRALAERDRLSARLADLELAGRGGTERLAAFEAQLSEALRRAEAAGGDAATQLRRLAEAGRTLAAEQAARRATEAQVTELAARAAAARAELDAARAEARALAETVQADRATIEARLADLARLSDQVRALTALRDGLERQLAQEAVRRRGAEEDAAGQARLAEGARAQIALLTRQLDALRGEVGRLAAALDAAEAGGRDKDAQIANLGSRLNAALAAQVEELQRYRSDFFGQLRQVLGERPEVRIVGDRFVFQSEVLFPPASAELSERGAAQVRDLARVLGELSARIPREVAWVLRVDGHADRAPIRSPRYATNWELSAARAIAVGQLLIAEGLPANRIAATAFGDNQPLDPADTPEAYARNRRIELRLTDR